MRRPRASATIRRCRHAANPPRAPPRSVLSAGVRPCGRCRKPGGAAIGVSRSTRTGSLSAAAAMVGAEPSSSAAAAAAMGPLAADRAARRRRRARAVGASRRDGARRPSSGPQVDVRRPELLQRGPAHARRPRRCSALVRALLCSCSRRAGRRCRVCMCVCRHAAGSRQMGADVASCGRAGCSPAGFDACAYQKYNFDFLKLTRLTRSRRSPSTAWKHMIIHAA